MMSVQNIFAVILLLSSFSVASGSLSKASGATANDSIRQHLQHCRRLLPGSPDSAFIVAGQALLTAQRTDAKQTVMFDIYDVLGRSAEQTGQYDIALTFFLKAMEYTKGTDDSRIAVACNYIGQIAFRQGKYDISMKYFPQALKIRIAQNDEEGQASSYRNIGSVFQAERKYKEASEHYLQSVALYTRIANVEGLAACYNNLGGLYAEQALYEDALNYYRQSEQLYAQSGGSDILTPIYNMGLAYSDLGETRRAMEYFHRALRIAQKTSDNKRLLAETYYSLGDYLNSICGQPDSAIAYLSSAITLSVQSNLDEVSAKALYTRAKAYSDLHRYTESVRDYEAATLMTEALSRRNQEKARVFTEQYMRYEADAFRQQQLQRGRMMQRFIVALILGILLSIYTAIILYRNNIQKKRANKELTRQRDEIEEKNDEIEAGIQAAGLLQRAVLTPDEYIRKLFSDIFILYKPQNTVSGDFYWMLRKGRYSVVVAADCTGHGVPGAVVSMLGISSLNQIVEKMDVPQSDLILNELRDDIIRLLNPEGSASDVRNGMDIALAVVDTQQKEIEFSGSKNALFLIRDGELTIVKPDRMPIGIDEQQDRPFTAQRIDYRTGDMIYLFSDGYVSQFDAADKKLFNSKRFKELLKTVSGTHVNEQLKMLDEQHNLWRGNTIQTDDILVIGIRL